jgi:hypothetical protein
LGVCAIAQCPLHITNRRPCALLIGAAVLSDQTLSARRAQYIKERKGAKFARVDSLRSQYVFLRTRSVFSPIVIDSSEAYGSSMSTSRGTKGRKVQPFDGPDSADGLEKRNATWSFDAQLPESSVGACFGEQCTAGATTASFRDTEIVGFQCPTGGSALSGD